MIDWQALVVTSLVVTYFFFYGGGCTVARCSLSLSLCTGALISLPSSSLLFLSCWKPQHRFDRNVNTSSPVGSSFIKFSSCCMQCFVCFFVYFSECSLVRIHHRWHPLSSLLDQHFSPLHLFLPTSINRQRSSAISTGEDEGFKLFPDRIIFTWPVCFFAFCSCDVALVFLTDFNVQSCFQSCWLVTQQKGTPFFFPLTSNPPRRRFSSDVSPHAAGRIIFFRASVWRRMGG